MKHFHRPPGCPPVTADERTRISEGETYNPHMIKRLLYDSGQLEVTEQNLAEEQRFTQALKATANQLDEQREDLVDEVDRLKGCIEQLKDREQELLTKMNEIPVLRADRDALFARVRWLLWYGSVDTENEPEYTDEQSARVQALLKEGGAS